MAIDYNVLPLKKGKTKRQLKARKDREDKRLLAEFRDQVWFREALHFGTTGVTARCQHCKAIVYRYDEYQMTGEVHHRIYRGNKATRYDPANGVLLCNHLVNNCHEKAERKLIQV